RASPVLAPFPGHTSVAGNLGTTIHGFAVTSDGTRMFVVGTKAQNRSPSAQGLVAVSQLKTGFVQSWLSVVDINNSTGAMTVRAEAPGNFGGFAPLFRSINLNQDYNFAIPTVANPNVVRTEVPAANALVQPTSVLLVESGGAVSKVVLTAFHSDKVAILTPSSSSPGGYSISRVAIPVLSGGYTTSGPRGLTR